jgi:asparagine synthase (glutamine-hydrolysing)
VRVYDVFGMIPPPSEVDEPVALAHVDGDWYQSTMVCLERIAPHLVEGGGIVIDDYFMWSGCREAVDEYFADRSGHLVEHRAKVHIVRL